MSTWREDIEIVRLGAGGDGVGHAADGRSVFTPFTLPGERITAQVTEDADGLRGKTVALLEPSPDRAEPPCRHFTICGGCALQHLNEAAYRAFKTGIVEDALKRHDLSVSDIHTIFVPAATRRRANFAALVSRTGTIVGFHERRSATIRDVPDCLLVTEQVRSVMNGIRPFLSDIAGIGNRIDLLVQCVDGEREVALTGKIAPGWQAQQALSDAMAALGLARISSRARDYEPYEPLLIAWPFRKRFGTLSVDLAPGAFLQPSDEGEEVLVGEVMRALEPSAGVQRVADLFCGNGTFTGALVDHGFESYAADSAGDAIMALRRAGVDAVTRNLFKAPLTEEELTMFDAVILDPPRAGALAQVERLARSGVTRVIYVSCNPQSFARDAAVLVGGGYRLERLTLVDQFIWSPHGELVGVFGRKMD